MTTRIGHFEIFVPDPAKSRDFYEKVLGFEVEDVQHGGAVIWLKKGPVTFLLRRGTPHVASTYQAANLGIVLYTDDLDAEAKDLKSRGLVFQGTDGSPRCLTFRDPDGTWFQLVDLKEQQV